MKNKKLLTLLTAVGISVVVSEASARSVNDIDSFSGETSNVYKTVRLSNMADLELEAGNTGCINIVC